MAFSSDIPQITNQLPFTINLPDIKNTSLFQDALEDLLRNISNAVNAKEGGLYNLFEQASSQQYYIQNNTGRFRNVYRKVMNFVNLNGGNIPAAAVALAFPHNMTGVQQSAGITANCTAIDGRRFTVVFPEVWIDATFAYFTNISGSDLSQCDIIINILKQVQIQT